ncbi:MAG: hypothetical protein ABIR62_00990 [Dokdonella sp.]
MDSPIGQVQGSGVHGEREVRPPIMIAHASVCNGNIGDRGAHQA